VAKQNEFVTHLLELLEPLGPVQARAMFGGFGIYLKGIMFGLVADNTLYFKVDEKNRPDYEEEGLGPFAYQRGTKKFTMSYYRAPAEAVDNTHDLYVWAEKAYDAAVRVSLHKQRKKRGKKGSR
jgi:DNA transformation protein